MEHRSVYYSVVLPDYVGFTDQILLFRMLYLSNCISLSNFMGCDLLTLPQ